MAKWITSCVCSGLGPSESEAPVCPESEERKVMFNLIWFLLFTVAPWVVSIYIIVVLAVTIYDTFFKDMVNNFINKYIDK